jgi:hypothetical protein
MRRIDEQARGRIIRALWASWFETHGVAALLTMRV